MRLTSIVTRAALGGIALFGVTFLDAGSRAEAQEYPWCARYNEVGGGATNCGFVNQYQCQATISGVGGFCIPNPRFGYRPYHRPY